MKVAKNRYKLVKSQLGKNKIYFIHYENEVPEIMHQRGTYTTLNINSLLLVVTVIMTNSDVQCGVDDVI